MSKMKCKLSFESCVFFENASFKEKLAFFGEQLKTKNVSVPDEKKECRSVDFLLCSTTNVNDLCKKK